MRRAGKGELGSGSNIHGAAGQRDVITFAFENHRLPDRGHAVRLIGSVFRHQFGRGVELKSGNRTRLGYDQLTGGQLRLIHCKTAVERGAVIDAEAQFLVADDFSFAQRIGKRGGCLIETHQFRFRQSRFAQIQLPVAGVGVDHITVKLLDQIG